MKETNEAQRHPANNALISERTIGPKLLHGLQPDKIGDDEFFY